MSEEKEIKKWIQAEARRSITMNATTPKITKELKKVIMSKSNTERFLIGCSINQAAREIVISSILSEYPNASHAIMRRELFLRFYKNDFDTKTRTRIVKHLMNCK